METLFDTFTASPAVCQASTESKAFSSQRGTGETTQFKPGGAHGSTIHQNGGFLLREPGWKMLKMSLGLFLWIIHVCKIIENHWACVCVFSIKKSVKKIIYNDMVSSIWIWKNSGKTCYCINLTGQVQRTEHNMGKTNPSSTADNYYPQKAESVDL